MPNNYPAETQSSFRLTAEGPLDAKFGPVADIAARDAIPTNERYLGMMVSVADIGGGISDIFALKDGVTNGDWTTVFGGGGGGGGAFSIDGSNNIVDQVNAQVLTDASNNFVWGTTPGSGDSPGNESIRNIIMSHYGYGTQYASGGNIERSFIIGGGYHSFYGSFNNSGIIGGYYNSINSGASYSTIIGGNNCVLIGGHNRSTILGGDVISSADSDTVHMPKVRIGLGAGGQLPTAGETHSLGYNDATGEVVRVSLVSAAGADTEIQYNDSGAFGASSNLSWNNGLGVLGVGPAGFGDLHEVSIRSTGGANNIDLYAPGATLITDRRIQLNAAAAGGDFQLHNSAGTATVRIVARAGIDSYFNTGETFVFGGFTGNAEAIVDIIGTSSLKIPDGTTAQRPSTPARGMIRFNNQTFEYEGYDDTQWVSFGGGGGDLETNLIFTSNLDPIQYFTQIGPVTIVSENFDSTTFDEMEYATSTDQGTTFTEHASFGDFQTAAAAFGGGQHWICRVTAQYEVGRTELNGLVITYNK